MNKGIRETILNKPSRFLAYNNGISATAADVSLTDLDDGGIGITEIRDLQIVNGGQTTASLHHAATRDKADLAGIAVQAKLTVVQADVIDDMVPYISKYSNTQNKVTGADFSANHPFHVQLEELSRTVWAPAPDGSQKQTRWFYERARGQYADELARRNSSVSAAVQDDLPDGSEVHKDGSSEVRPHLDPATPDCRARWGEEFP